MSVLAQWGARSLGKPQPDQKIVTESIIFMILGMFWREQTADFSLTCKVHVADQRHAYWVRLTNAGAEFLETHSDVTDVIFAWVSGDLASFKQWANTLPSAIETGLLDLESKQPNIDKLISLVDAR